MTKNLTFAKQDRKILISIDKLTFYIALVLWLFFYYFNNSTFNATYSWSSAVNIISILLLSVSILFNLSLKQRMAYVFMLIICMFMFVLLSDWNIGMFVMMMFMLASNKIEMDDVLKIYLRSAIICSAVIMLSCQFGLIENLDIGRLTGEGQSLGFTNVLAPIYFFFITLYYYAYKKEKASYVVSAVFLIINQILFSLCYVRASYYFEIAVVAVFVLIKIISKAKRKKGMTLTFKKPFLYFLYSLPVISMAVSFLITYLYEIGTESILELNILLTGRIRLQSKALSIYGLKLFGRKIVWSMEIGKNYLYVDSSYIKYSIMYGIIFVVIVLALFTASLVFMAKNKQYYYMIAVAFVLLYSIFNPQLLYLQVNPFLLYFTMMIKTVSNNVKSGGQNENSSIGSDKTKFSKTAT